MQWGRVVATDLLNGDCLRLEDEPIHTAHESVTLPVNPCPFHRRCVSNDITQQEVHRPVKTMFLYHLRKIATDGDCPEPLCAPRWKIMHRVRPEALGNHLGIGVVASLDIRSNNLFHLLSNCGLHRNLPCCPDDSLCARARLSWASAEIPATPFKAVR